MRLLLAATLFLAACGGASKSASAPRSESEAPAEEPAPTGGVITPGMVEPDAAGGGAQSPSPPPPTAPSAVPSSTPSPSLPSGTRGGPSKSKGSSKTEDPCMGGE